MSLSPEIIAEQVMGYVVWAEELISALQPTNQLYHIALLPQWPHFYTWLLQAAGYLLLNNKKKIIIISQQSQSPKDIFIDQNSYEPVCGYIPKNVAKSKITIAHILGAKKMPVIPWILEEQLAFLHVITQTTTVIHLAIGDRLSPTKINKLIRWMFEHIQEYNIVLLSNIQLPVKTRSLKMNDQIKIARYIQTSSSIPILTIFQKLLALTKKRPKIIAYVSPWDFNKNISLFTRYVCAVW